MEIDELDDETLERWLRTYETRLMDVDRRRAVELSLPWERTFEYEPGVYVVFNHTRIVYVGETASLRSRMNNLRHTQQHTLRRTVGRSEFRDVPGFQEATSSKKFPAHVETMVIDFLNSLQLAATRVPFGRKEVEEFLVSKYDPTYNQR